MKRDVKEDCKLLEPLKLNLNRMKPYADSKLIALKAQLAKDQVFEKDGKKAIIFTQFVDTARYISENLQLKKYLRRRVFLIHTERPQLYAHYIKDLKTEILTPFIGQEYAIS